MDLFQKLPVRMLCLVLLMLKAESQGLVECGKSGAKSSHLRLSHEYLIITSPFVPTGTRHFLKAHRLTVYQLEGQNVSFVPYIDPNGTALEWYVRPRSGSARKELLKHLLVLKTYALALTNMSSDCQRTTYYYRWWADSSKKVKVFESAFATVLIGGKV